MLNGFKDFFDESTISCLNCFLLVQKYSKHLNFSLIYIGFPEHVHEYCASKEDASDIWISCKPHHIIAIHEGYLSATTNQRCPFLMSKPELNNLTFDYDANIYPKFQPCVDDLRLSLNRRYGLLDVEKADLSWKCSRFL